MSDKFVSDTVVSEDAPELGWHFVASDRKLRYLPNVVIAEGLELVCDQPLEPHVNGMHAARTIIEALNHTPGQNATMICRVAVYGRVIEYDTDAFCAEKRKVLWVADATATLKEIRNAFGEIGYFRASSSAAKLIEKKFLDLEASKI